MMKNYKSLEQHVPSVVDEVITNLIENEGITWPESQQICSASDVYSKTKKLLELVINKKRLKPFLDCLSKYLPKIVADIYSRQSTYEKQSQSHQDYEAMIRDMYEMLRRQEIRDAEREVKDEERDAKYAERDENERQMQESLKRMENLMTDITVSMKKLSNGTEKREGKFEDENEKEQDSDEKYDLLNKRVQELEQEKESLRTHQIGLRNRIIELQDRLTLLHKERANMKASEKLSEQKQKEMEKEMAELQSEIKHLQRKLGSRTSFLSLFEQQLKLVMEENVRLHETIKDLREAKSTQKKNEASQRESETESVYESRPPRELTSSYLSRVDKKYN